MCVCVLPFFSATAESFTLKFGTVFWNDIGKTANNFGVHWMHISYIIFLNVCMFVCYRFSRQPLNRLLWNLARCFEMISERQLTILVSIGCVFHELSHMRYCVILGQNQLRNRYSDVTMVWFHIHKCFVFGFIWRQTSNLGTFIWRRWTDGLRARRATGDKI